MHNLRNLRCCLQRCAFGILILGSSLTWQTWGHSQETQGAGTQETQGVGTQSAENATLAWLGEQPITTADVDFLLGRARSGPLRDTELAKSVVDAAVFIIAQQRQALQTLRKLNQAAARDVVDRWITEHGLPTPDATRSVESIAQQIADAFGITVDAYMESIAFRLSWEAYLARHLTEENVERHFANQRRRFNGTEFRISMVSVAVDVGESEQRSAAHRQLDALAEQLTPAAEDWRDAIEPESNPSWDITQARWVAGNGELENAIVEALLRRTAEDSWSSPIDTLSGVHLVRLEGVRKGARELSEVRGEVRAHMLVYLLDHLAGQSRDQLPLRSRARVADERPNLP